MPDRFARRCLQRARATKRCQEHRELSFRLIARLSRTRRDDGHGIVRCHLLVSRVDLRLVEVRFVHARPKIVGHQHLAQTFIKCEGAHVRADPVGQLLRPRELGKRVAGNTKRRDEQLGLADFSRVRIDDAELLARVVHEQLLARHMRLSQRDRQPLCPFLIGLAEPAVTVAVRVLCLVFLP
ncbi:hypothetical protein R69927_07488 [Paraburkholderia domus]|nr:hypothetical protein R69927_07488 [Paraburkholderia domus]